MAPPRMVVVIGGSSGALEAVRTIVAALPGDLDAALFLVIHTAPNSLGVVDRILTRAGHLPASYPVDGEPIEAGRIYVAPPDRHLLVMPAFARVTRGPRENRFRPAVDPLFRTAAKAFGPRTIGVILSGGQDDGVAGLAYIKSRGGTAIVQDPAEAPSPGMPEAAIRHLAVDQVLPADQIGPLLVQLVRDFATDRAVMTSKPTNPDAAEHGAHDIHHSASIGAPTPFTCPDCGGTLWRIEEGAIEQYRCHLGHRYSVDSLAGAQDDALDEALWAALRALEESAELRRRMALRARDRHMEVIAEGYERHAAESEGRARVIRRLLMPEPERQTSKEPEPAASAAKN